VPSGAGEHVIAQRIAQLDRLADPTIVGGGDHVDGARGRMQANISQVGLAAHGAFEGPIADRGEHPDPPMFLMADLNYEVTVILVMGREHHLTVGAVEDLVDGKDFRKARGYPFRNKWFLLTVWITGTGIRWIKSLRPVGLGGDDPGQFENARWW
jgi:hypothetical protein